MEPFKFECHAVDVEHSCSHGNEGEPQHPHELLKCIESIVEATKEMTFHGIIKSPKNNYQITSDFDSSWIGAMKTSGWQCNQHGDFGELQTISHIKPDAILSRDNLTVGVEIEKTNKKTIWFDLIKLMMLAGMDVAKFGILVVPRNYAHKINVWDLFKDARYYKWCLE